MFADPTLNITSGPYGVIFSSFVPFYLDIPVSTRFRVFGLRFSDKSFIYLAGLQVIEMLLWQLSGTWDNSKCIDTLCPPSPSPCLSHFRCSHSSHLNLSLYLAASSVILEKIYFARNMRHPGWFLISFKFPSNPQAEGYVLSCNFLKFVYLLFYLHISTCRLKC